MDGVPELSNGGQMRRVTSRTNRKGSAAMELAVLLPLLLFLFVAAVDFTRIFHFSQVIGSCARNGALYGSNLTTYTSPYASIQAAALADATNLSPQPTVTSTTGNDSSGNPFVRVTVTWQYRAITGFPGIPNTVNISRTVQMRVAP